MDDGHTDEPTGALDPASLDADAELGEPGGPDPWGGVGARRGPRQPAEGVRIINAEEAAAALEKGQAARRRPEDAPRFGDVPEPPSGPRPSLRFPGADPAAVSKPPVAGPEPRGPEPRAPEPRAPEPRTPEPRVVQPRVVEPRIAEPPPSAFDVPAAPSYDGPFDPADDAAFWGDDVDLPAVGRVPASAPGSASGRRIEPPAWPDDEPNPFWDDPPAEVMRGARASGAPGGGVPGGAPGEQNVAEGTSSLPHWTEPPSGEVPRILADDDPPPPAGGDDFNAWSTLSTGPRWRDQHTDWDEADFKDEVLDDPGTRVGALRSGSPDDFDYGYDDVVEDPPPPPPEPAPTRAATRSRRPGPSRRSPHPPPERRQPAAGAASPPRDMRASVTTGVVALAVVLIAAFIGPAALVLLVAVVLVLAASELFQALRSNGYRPATLLGLVGTAAMSGAVYWRGLDGAVLVITLYMIASLLWYLFGAVRARPVGNVAATLLGFLYVGFLGSFAALLLKYPLNHGIGLLVGAVIATAAYDVGALFAGRWAGRTPLAPDISPGKTVEGMVGASFAALVACIVVVGNIHPWTTTRAFWLAIVVAGAAPLGDLCESMLKRDLGIKDMGSLLPGHGGVLDRIDALLFVVPATFYLVRLLNFA